MTTAAAELPLAACSVCKTPGPKNCLLTRVVSTMPLTLKVSFFTRPGLHGAEARAFSVPTQALAACTGQPGEPGCWTASSPSQEGSGDQSQMQYSPW